MKITTNNLLIQPSVSGGAIIHFDTLDLKYQPELMHKYDGKDMVVEIKAKRKGRSLDANAYMWVLCDKIASVKGLLLKKSEVYKQAIRDYGLSAILPLENAQLDEILRSHKNGGLGNDYDVLGASKFEGYTNVRLYWGSSNYSSYQMSILIDGLRADCIDLGIEVETPDELAKMKQQWGV